MFSCLIEDFCLYKLIELFSRLHDSVFHIIDLKCRFPVAVHKVYKFNKAYVSFPEVIQHPIINQFHIIKIIRFYLGKLVILRFPGFVSCLNFCF